MVNNNNNNNNNLFLINQTDSMISLIHSGYLYSAPSRNLLRGALSSATAKQKSRLERCYNTSLMRSEYMVVECSQMHVHLRVDSERIAKVSLGFLTHILVLSYY